MATYRQVYTSFWQDDFILSLTPTEKYFYLYLMTNTKTSICGIYELPRPIAVIETGLAIGKINDLLTRFETVHHKIVCSKTTNEVCITNWMKYNDNQSPRVQTAIKTALESVKDRVLIQYLYSMEAISPARVTVSVNDNALVSDIVLVSKDVKEEKSKVEIQDQVFKGYAVEDETLYNALLSFLEMRNKIKKPMTEEAKRLLCHRLDKFKNGGSNIIDVINQSILNSWQNVYELKQDFASAKPETFEEEIARRAKAIDVYMGVKQ